MTSENIKTAILESFDMFLTAFLWCAITMVVIIVGVLCLVLPIIMITYYAPYGWYFIGCVIILYILCAVYVTIKHVDEQTKY